MKRHYSIATTCSFFFMLCLLALALNTGEVHAAKAKEGGFTSSPAAAETGGYTGPGPALVTAKAAGDMPDGTWMSLKGQIVRQEGGKMYVFKDASGEIPVKIGGKAWRGAKVGAEDQVELRGKMHKELRGNHVDVKQVIKVQ